VLALLLNLLFSTLLVDAALCAVEDYFPPMKKGCWYYYEGNSTITALNWTITNTTKLLANYSIHRMLQSFNYCIVDVGKDWAKIQLHYKRYFENGTVEHESSVVFHYWNVTHLKHVEPFFNVKNVTESLEDHLAGFTGARMFGYYTIGFTNYTFMGRTFRCVYGYYVVYGGANNTKSAEGYFIVSLDYGLAFEMAKVVYFYYPTAASNSSKRIAPISMDVKLSSAVKLVATNFAPLLGKAAEELAITLLQNWWIIVLIPVLIVVPVVLFIWAKRRKST